MDLPKIAITPAEKPPQAEGFVVARPMDERVEKPVIKVAGGQKEAAAGGASTERAPLIVRTREKSGTESGHAIVTVRPAGDPVVQAKPDVEGADPRAPVKPLPPVELPEPLITIEPTAPAESDAVVTVRPAAETDEAKAPKPPAPPTRVATATVATDSHGLKKMAKPWERLGRPAAAARDFYLHAPSLSNY